MVYSPIHSCPALMDCIRQVGFLPLLESGVPGFAAESLMAEESFQRMVDHLSSLLPDATEKQIKRILK